MAAQYDALGNYLGDWETEEERRKREEEYANTAIKTQEVKTYGDGTVERTTKEEMAPAIQQPRVRPVQQTAVAQPVAPISPEDYNRMIQRQESGNRPNIGFHNQQLSSAYGPYGTTAAGWADARKVNPNLPQDITQATPEQLTAGQNAYTQQNAKYLQAYGVEPTQNNLAAAHFLGAKGLADYLQTKAISPQAAAANGGEENVRRIVDARLGGQAAPASGAAQSPGAGRGFVNPQAVVPEQTQQAPNSFDEFGTPVYSQAQTDLDKYLNAFNTAQNDPMKLLALRNDENAPTWLRERAGETASDVLNLETQKKKTTETATPLIAAAAAGDRKASMTIAKELQNQEGSWLKMILLGFLSPQLAGEEAIKLGFGNKWIQGSDIEGKPAMIQVNARGLPLKGYKADGTAIETNDLINYTSGNAENIKTLQTQAHHSAASTMDQMRKLNAERADKLLPPMYSEDQILQRGREVYDQTMRVSRQGSRLAGQTSMTGATTASTTASTTAPTTAAVAPMAAQPVYMTFDNKPSTVLGNWDKQRVGESSKDYGKRLEIRPEDIEETAQALAKGQIKPTELTGRQNDFRRVALQRALEINPKYSPQTYAQVEQVLKRYTSGKDHDTLVNTGTAVNHLMQYKDIAANTPGNTDVSSWNTFYQNLMKYGNAPEIKSKEQMAGFVAGELVKAASGGQGSMTERIHQEQQLMKANTPAEIQMVIDNAIKLAHGRYSSMRSSFMGATGRTKQEFNDLVGMPEEARVAFDKIDAQHTIKSQGSAAEKWARENPNDPRAKEILKRLGK